MLDRNLIGIIRIYKDGNIFFSNGLLQRAETKEITNASDDIRPKDVVVVYLF